MALKRKLSFDGVSPALDPKYLKGMPMPKTKGSGGQMPMPRPRPGKPGSMPAPQPKAGSMPPPKPSSPVPGDKAGQQMPEPQPKPASVPPADLEQDAQPEGLAHGHAPDDGQAHGHAPQPQAGSMPPPKPSSPVPGGKAKKQMPKPQPKPADLEQDAQPEGLAHGHAPDDGQAFASPTRLVPGVSSPGTQAVPDSASSLPGSAGHSALPSQALPDPAASLPAKGPDPATSLPAQGSAGHSAVPPAGPADESQMTVALGADSQESLLGGACDGLVAANVSISKAARQVGGLPKGDYDKLYRQFVYHGRAGEDMTDEQISDFSSRTGRKKLFQIWLKSGKSFAKATLMEKALPRNASGGRYVC